MPKKTAKTNPAPAVKPITELELISVETTRIQLAQLRKQVRQAETALEQMETDLIDRIKAKAPIQGSRTAVVQVETGASRPKYQELWVGHMKKEHGLTEDAAIEQAKAAYPGKPHDVLVIGTKPESV